MLFKRNVLGWERIVRAVVAIRLLIAVVAVSLAGMVGWIVGLWGRNGWVRQPRRCSPRAGPARALLRPRWA